MHAVQIQSPTCTCDQSLSRRGVSPLRFGNPSLTCVAVTWPIFSQNYLTTHSERSCFANLSHHTTYDQPEFNMYFTERWIWNLMDIIFWLRRIQCMQSIFNFRWFTFTWLCVTEDITLFHLLPPVRRTLQLLAAFIKSGTCIFQFVRILYYHFYSKHSSSNIDKHGWEHGHIYVAMSGDIIIQINFWNQKVYWV